MPSTPDAETARLDARYGSLRRIIVRHLDADDLNGEELVTDFEAAVREEQAVELLAQYDEHTCCPHPFLRMEDSVGGRTAPTRGQPRPSFKRRSRRCGRHLSSSASKTTSTTCTMRGAQMHRRAALLHHELRRAWGLLASVALPAADGAQS